MNNLLLGAELSKLAYLPQNDAAVGAFEFGLNSFDWIDNKETDCQAFVCGDDLNAYVSIRGTEFENWADWQTNLDCEFVPSKYGMVHRGFRNDANSIYLDVLQALVKHRVKYKQIYVMGHSQGAAVAKQLALLLLKDHVEISGAFGYGEPRNVDRYCAANIQSKFPGIFHRIVNNCDLITRVPCRVMGYKHFGQLHYFKEGGEYTTDISAWKRFLDRMAGRIADLDEAGLDAIKDHDINDYIGLLKNEFGS